MHMKTLEVPVMLCVIWPMWLSEENCCSRQDQYRLDYLDVTEDTLTEPRPCSAVLWREAKHLVMIHLHMGI